MPWIPAAVWSAKEAEVLWLRAQLEAKHEHERRMERVTVGLPESPKKPPPSLGPMPQTLQDALDSYEQGPAKEQLRASFLSLGKKYGNWDDVVVHVAREMTLEEE